MTSTTQSKTFTCTFCGKTARGTAERNCTSPDSPDARHARPETTPEG